MIKKIFSYAILALLFIMEIIIASPVNSEMRIMPLGNSITRGTAGSTDDIGYRRSLYLSLTAAGYDVDFVGSLRDGIPDDFDDDHEGHGGKTADYLRDNIYNWLVDNPADVILLHIGTNDISIGDINVDGVEGILDNIDQYETDYHTEIIVILARIINRIGYDCPNASKTTTFNDDVEAMAEARIDNGDKIYLLDMECGAKIIYSSIDFADTVHPNDSGYEKMADYWLYGLQAILPVADAGPDQNEYEGNIVTLDASQSYDPDGVIVSYFWEQQLGGPLISLSDFGAVKPTFTAPNVESGGETLTFKVTVTDADGLESTDITYVNVSNDNCPNDPNKTEPGVCGCGTADTDSDNDGTADCNETSVATDSGGSGGSSGVCFISTAAN